MSMLLATTAAVATGQEPVIPPDPLELTIPIGRMEGFGARSLGMGGAFLATADDATAALWNPAGLARNIRKTFQLGGEYTRISRNRDFSVELSGTGGDHSYSTLFQLQESSGASTESFSPSFLSLTLPIETQRVGKWIFAASIVRTASLSERCSFEQPTDYEVYLGDPGNPESPPVETWYLDIKQPELKNIQRGNIDTFNISLAQHIDYKFHYGITITYLRGRRDLSKQYVSPLFHGTFCSTPECSNPVLVEGRDLVFEESWSSLFDGWYATVGLLYKAGELSFGIVYRSELSMDYRFDTWRGWEYNGGEITGGYSDVSSGEDWHWAGSTTIDMPSMLGAGVAWRPEALAGFTLAFDYLTSDWRSTTVTIDGRGVFLYPSLMIIQRPARDPDNEPSGDWEEVIGGKQYRDEVLRLGTEYIFRPPGKRPLQMPVRAGAYIEKAVSGLSGSRQPEIRGVSAGIGLRWRRCFVDSAVTYDTAKIDISPGTRIQSEFPWYPTGRRGSFSDQPFLTTEFRQRGGEFKQSSLRFLVSVGYEW
jgi:long-subunit fatty acid transport protein